MKAFNSSFTIFTSMSRSKNFIPNIFVCFFVCLFFFFLNLEIVMNELQRFMYRYVCQLISCKYFPYYWISPVLASGVKDPLAQLHLKTNTPGPWLLRISKLQFSLVNIFKKVAQISSLCEFHYINEGTPSLMHFWFVMTKGLHVWLMLIFARPDKMH